MKRKKLIEFRGPLKQKDMANAYGVSQQTWSRWECGTNTPTPSKMKQIANDIGKSVDEVFFDIFNNKSCNTGYGENDFTD